jgi:hypothetical protein
MDNKQPNNRGFSLRLFTFWAENTESWFAIAETRFRLKWVDDQQDMFDQVLPKESLCIVLDLITDPPFTGGQPLRAAEGTSLCFSSSADRFPDECTGRTEAF